MVGIKMDGCGWSWATPIAMEWVKTYVVGEYQQSL